MLSKMKEVFVISDLHVGGAAPQGNDTRGFQICTQTAILADFIYNLAARKDAYIELIINGDVIDFLAERPFAAFTPTPTEAVAKLRQIVEREYQFFDSLKALLEADHQLTILLGNHDIELALPAVRAYFEQAIGALGRNYHFIGNGEAYTIGNEVLIEHGNRYDEWNAVDYANLQELAISQSRRETNNNFNPPKGSRMVEEVINQIKEKYRFIDLLKPETGAVMPILLALEPSYRKNISKILSIYWQLNTKQYTDSIKALVASRSLGLPEDREVSEEELGDRLIEQELTKMLKEDAEVEAFKESAGIEQEMNITEKGNLPAGERGFFSTAVSFVDLLFRNNKSDIDKRLPSLYQALSALQTDRSFDPSRENLKEYLTAAQKLADNGFKYILFGHTHFARKVALKTPGTYYFNSGTWADLMQIPPDLLTAETEDAAFPLLRNFMSDLMGNKIDKHIVFKPTYIHIQLNKAGRVSGIDLKTYEC
jgi:UDP-2,3-diacylglucosamine pyrophosphatase LpxH